MWKSPMFIEPMLSEATSGLNFIAGSTRSSTRMVGAPPVVRFTTALVALLDARQEAAEGFGRLVRLAGLGVARMQVDDRRAGLGRADRRIADLVRRHRQVGRHRGGVDRAGHGAGDDDLALLGHGVALL
jgi:hypothetical protein